MPPEEPPVVDAWIENALRSALERRGCPPETAAELAGELRFERYDAEANDRTARGESGWPPLWPLPGRRPRRS